MPIQPRESAPNTYEYKIERVIETLNKMPNQFDAQLIRNLILELCQRHITTCKELETHINSNIQALERRYQEQIIKDLKIFE